MARVKIRASSREPAVRKGLRSDGHYVYWTNASNGTIGRANLDGTNVNSSFITGADNPISIAVDAGHVYWGNTNGARISRANLDGTNVDLSFITGVYPAGIAVDAGHIYWTDTARSGTRSAGRTSTVRA